MKPEKIVMTKPMTGKVLKARERHGKPFAFEPGSNWQPRAVPVLTQWLQSRGKQA